MMTRNREITSPRGEMMPYQRTGDVPARGGSLFRRSPWAGVVLVLGLTFMALTFLSWVIDKSFRLAEAAIESSQAVAQAAVETSVVTRQVVDDVQGHGVVMAMLVIGICLVFFGIGKLK